MATRDLAGTVALVTGDQRTAEESEAFMPGAERVVVKQSITRFSASNLHPEVARQLIREGARRAVERAGELSPPAISLPARLDISFHNADMAEISTWARGIERTGLSTVAIEGEDPLSMFRSFVAMTYLTRQVEGR